MTKPPPVCEECNREIIGVEPIAFAHNAAGPLLCHPGVCDENRREKVADLTTCLACGRSFDRRQGVGRPRPGRLPDFCSSRCRKQRDRMRSRTWRAAAKGQLPDGIEGIQARLNDLQALALDITSGRLNGQTPASARALLEGYAGRLHDRERELRQALSAASEQRRSEALRQYLADQRAAEEKAAAKFMEELDDAAK